MSITDDVQHRSAHIHWPADADPDRADLFAHNDIVINAPAEVIWDRLIRAAAWPDWYSNAASVTVNDPGGMLVPASPSRPTRATCTAATTCGTSA